MRFFLRVTLFLVLFPAAMAMSQDIGDDCTDNEQCETLFCIDGVCCNILCGEGRTDDCLVCSVATGGSTDGMCEIASQVTVCRPSAGPCDAEELCVGEDSFCPEDALKEAGEPCGGLENPCVTGGACNGESAECPVESSVLDGTPCPDGICIAGECIPEPDGPGDMDASVPGGGGSGGTGTGGSAGDPNPEAGGVCAGSVATSPVESPLAQSLLLLLLFSFVRAIRRR